MSFVDKAIDALTPKESEQDRLEATTQVRAAATPGDWLSMALDHHDEIRRCFDRAVAATGSGERLEAMEQLAEVLNGHSLAEEIVLYPALADEGEKSDAMMGYTEQAAAKMEMAELERIDPSSDDWGDQIRKIREAVLHHMYHEEKDWFPELKEKGLDQAHLTKRYEEEFTRYAGAGRSAI